MRIYLDIDSRRLFSAPGRPLSKLDFKRRDNDTIELIFLRDDIGQDLAAGTIAKIGVKADAAFDSEFLAVTTLAKTGTGASTVYTGELNFNTTAMASAFSTEPVTLAAMLEVEWLTGSAISSSKTLPVTLYNDVIRGDEGEPATLPLFYASATSDFKATQAEAEAGTDNVTWMTPLRTAEAIAALGGASSWNDLEDKPTAFPPATHAHAVADVTGLQTALDGKSGTTHSHSLSDLAASGAAAGQVATYDGTAWVPQDASSGGVTSYNDLTDVPSTFAPSAHSHAASDITSGTLAIARIPTGTTSTTVALGNHTHSGFVTSSQVTNLMVVTSMPDVPSPDTLYIVTL